MTTRKLLAAGAVGLLMTLGLAGQAFAYTATAQYAVTDFATGFTDVGPIGLAFDSSNHLFVMEYPQGILYKFGTSGGAASATTRLNTVGIPGAPAGIAFAKDGRLYAARQSSGDLIEISPTTGALLRVVADGLSFATGIATDPLSGDLFVTGPSPSDNKVWRISAFSGAGATVTTYAEVYAPDGITFGPDGTIYVASEGKAKKIGGTNTLAPHTATNIADVPSIDGIALAAGSSGTSPTAIFGNRNDGKISKVDLTKNPVEVTNIVTGGTRGDFSAVGPDGCLYATQSRTVAKVTNADGTCSFAPTVVVPILRLTPPTTTAAVQTSVTVTATLTNVTTGSGHVVTFTVTGANPRVGTATTNSSGKATFAYTGTNTGIDTVVATTTSGEQVVTSNTAKVTWTPVVLPPTGSGTPVPVGLALVLGVLMVAMGGVLLVRPRS
jgi:sugar lactone lactonase YvrE